MSELSLKGKWEPGWGPRQKGQQQHVPRPGSRKEGSFQGVLSCSVRLGRWLELEGTERRQGNLERLEGRSHRTCLRNEHFLGGVGNHGMGNDMIGPQPQWIHQPEYICVYFQNTALIVAFFKKIAVTIPVHC